MAPIPTRIETERLVLRPWSPDEAVILGPIVEANLDHLRPWMPWVRFEPLDLAARRSLLERWQGEWERGESFAFGIWFDGEAVGNASLMARIGVGGLEVGYWIAREHEGRGLATEVAWALSEAGLQADGVSRIEIHHDAANARSRRVPEKLGFVLVDERPPTADDVVLPGETGITCVWRLDA